jgi:hypothetical protein
VTLGVTPRLESWYRGSKQPERRNLWDTTDTTNANQSVLIYDAATAKVSKASTFRLNESATEFPLSALSVQLKNGNNYNNVTTSGLTTYYAPQRSLSLVALLQWGLEEVITTSTQATTQQA